MNKVDEFYKDLLSEILSDGFEYDDPNRKGTKRYQPRISSCLQKIIL